MTLRTFGVCAATVLASLTLASTSLAAGPTLTAEGTVISWTAVTGATEYQIGLSPVSPEKCAEEPCFIQKVFAPTTSEDEAGIADGWTYTFKVREKKPKLGEWSNAVEITYPVENKSEAVKVSAKPHGPTGNFSVVYADGFGEPLGSGHDTTLTPKETAAGHKGCCDNSNEIMVERPSKVKQSKGLLELICSKEEVVSGLPYTCGGVKSSTFNWKPGGTQTFVFETVAKLPDNTGGGQDPGWWTDDIPWTDEIDFFEAWGWGTHTPAHEYYMGIPCWLPKAGAGEDVCNEIYSPATEIGNLTETYHTYTTVVKGSELTEYIDGVRFTKGTHSGLVKPSQSINTPWMRLLLTHAMREKSTATTDTAFDIKSIAVYEEGTGNVEGGGVAPGTVIE